MDLSEYGTPEELFAPVPAEAAGEEERIDAPAYSYWRSVARVFFSKKINWLLLGLLLVIVVFSFLYPAVIGYDPEVDPYANLLDSESRHLTPQKAIEKYGFGLKWIFGTGAAGQSTFDAVWYGAGISLSLALIAAAINLTVGVAVGALWGMSRRVDKVMTEIYNIFANIPYILLISVLVLVLSADFWTMVLALTVTGWLGIAYFIRTQVMIIRDREYNLASRCLGTPLWRILVRNVLPYMTSVVVTLAAAEIPSYISYEVFLSYIGMGISQMSLGKLIQSAQSAMLTPGWGMEFWSPVAVASAITVVLYVLGQNLGDASDPKRHI
ncbi:MAG: ABC transporter permease [Oscillospiraceae bacterium]|nr:ABC transporter permease [Oscillospiraceae bacterium]